MISLRYPGVDRLLFVRRLFCRRALLRGVSRLVETMGSGQVAKAHAYGIHCSCCWRQDSYVSCVHRIASAACILDVPVSGEARETA